MRNELDDGIKRRIGTRRSTRIWEDRWIPNCNQGQPITKKPPGCTLQKVVGLITGHRWNRPLIYMLFKEKEAEDILSIPISVVDKEDSTFWPDNKNVAVRL